jgi:hypothetical protein
MRLGNRPYIFFVKKVKIVKIVLDITIIMVYVKHNEIEGRHTGRWK